LNRSGSSADSRISILICGALPRRRYAKAAKDFYGQKILRVQFINGIKLQIP